MGIPSRTAIDNYLSQMGPHLDMIFDADLGELTQGHHIVARGILLGRPVRVLRPEARPDPRADERGEQLWRPSLSRRGHGPQAVPSEELMTGAELHYEFVPGISAWVQAGRFSRDWMLAAAYDSGTDYDDYNSGAFDTNPGKPASHGTRDLGGQIPPEATRPDP